MKIKFLYAVIVFLLVSANSSAQATIRFNQTFSSMSAVKILMDVESSNIEVQTIKGSRILVEMAIKISSPNERLLEFIAEQGRYDLEKKFDQSINSLTLASKKNKDVLIIKGEEIREEFAYILYLPETTEFVRESIASH